MIGAAGRIYLAGPTADVRRAQAEITGCWPPSPAGSSSHERLRTWRARPVGRRGRHGPGHGVRPRGAAPLRLPPRRVRRAAQRLGERDLPGRRPRRRALGAAGAPARLPHRAGDRVRAGLDGRAARRGRGAHAAGAARCRRPAGGDGARRPAAGRTALRALRVPARHRAGRRAGEHADRRHFAELGEITARMHRHAREWPRPPWFTRFHWDYDAAFGAAARWGRWQDGIGVGPAERRVLARLDEALRARLAAFGTGPGALRPGARRHPAGQPAGARRLGQRHRLRRLRVQLVPVRPGHLGELLRARAARCPAWWTAG